MCRMLAQIGRIGEIVPQSDTATLPCGGSAEWLSILVTKGVRHHLRGVEVVNGSVVSWCVVRTLQPVAT